MTGQHRQFPSVVSLPRQPLAASPTFGPPLSLDVKLTPRPVYPVRVFIAAEGLQLVSLLYVHGLSESALGDHRVYVGVRRMCNTVPTASAA